MCKKGGCFFPCHTLIAKNKLYTIISTVLIRVFRKFQRESLRISQNPIFLLKISGNVRFSEVCIIITTGKLRDISFGFKKALLRAFSYPRSYTFMFALNKSLPGSYRFLDFFIDNHKGKIFFLSIKGNRGEATCR